MEKFEQNPDVKIITIRNQWGVYVTIKKDVYKWIRTLSNWHELAIKDTIFQESISKLKYDSMEIDLGYKRIQNNLEMVQESLSDSLINLSSASEECFKIEKARMEMYKKHLNNDRLKIGCWPKHIRSKEEDLVSENGLIISRKLDFLENSNNNNKEEPKLRFDPRFHVVHPKRPKSPKYKSRYLKPTYLEYLQLIKKNKRDRMK